MDIYNITNIPNIASLLYTTNSSIKNKLLEPLNCLLRLSLLRYKPDGTKLSIHENSILYHEKSFIQGILRTFNDDKRDDLHNLFNPIYYSTQWFPITNEKYKFIFEQSLIGLDKLINTYDNESIIHHTLNHYKLIIYNHINEINSENIINTNNTENSIENDISDNDINNKTNNEINNVTTYIKNIWNSDEINILYDLLFYLNKVSDKELISLYSNMIESILKNKEIELYNYLVNISTKYN